MGSRNIYFDHDYPPEIVTKRKEYAVIKKSLKDKGIRFQTPFTNMRIHWATGVRTYRSAREAYNELKRRGLQVEEPTTSDGESATPARLRELLGWQREGPGPSVAWRAKAKLQEFYRDGGGADKP